MDPRQKPVFGSHIPQLGVVKGAVREPNAGKIFAAVYKICWWLESATSIDRFEFLKHCAAVLRMCGSGSFCRSRSWGMDLPVSGPNRESALAGRQTRKTGLRLENLNMTSTTLSADGVPTAIACNARAIESICEILAMGGSPIGLAFVFLGAILAESAISVGIHSLRLTAEMGQGFDRRATKIGRAVSYYLGQCGRGLGGPVGAGRDLAKCNGRCPEGS